MGQRLNIIIIAEGAIDCEGKSITPDSIRDVSNQQILAVAVRYCFVFYLEGSRLIVESPASAIFKSYFGNFPVLTFVVVGWTGRRNGKIGMLNENRNC